MYACCFVDRIDMGNSLDQRRESIGLFTSRSIFKQRVKVNVSIAFIFHFLIYLLKRTWWGA